MQRNAGTCNEWIITLIIKLSGYSSILFVSLILLFLLREGLPALGDVPLSSLFGTRWYPIEELFRHLAADLRLAGGDPGRRC